MKFKCHTAWISLFLLLLFTSRGYGGEWCVQVSTFRNIEGIREDFQKVKNFNEARIEKIEDIYVLRVGFFSTEARAKGELKSIREEFPKAFVRKCADEPHRVIEAAKSAKRKQSPDRLHQGEVGTKDKPVEKTGRGVQQAAPASAVPFKVSPPVANKPPVKGPATSSQSEVNQKKPPTHSATSPPAAAKQAPPSTAPPVPIESITSSASAGPKIPSVLEAPVAASPRPSTDPSDPRQLYDEAEKHRRNGNYRPAIDLYKQVIQLAAPDGELAGKASYKAAHCYDILGEKKASASGYAQAIDRWPGLDTAPMPILFAGGMKAYDDRKYEGALKIFSLYLAAYPEDSRRTEYMLACTLLQQGRYNPALFLFGRIIEKYPDSPEAVESIVAFGNIGLKVPRVRVTMFVKGWEWYRDPVHAYDTALRMKPDRLVADRILFIKGCALVVLGRHVEAHRILTKSLKACALSKNVKVYREAIGFNLPHLLKISYKHEDYAGVVGVYFQAAGNNVPLPVDAATVIIIGRSLHRMGLNEDAFNFLKAARIKSTGKDAEEIGRVVDELSKPVAPDQECDTILKNYKDTQAAGQTETPILAFRAADCLFLAGQFTDALPIYNGLLGQAITMDEKRWALLRLGKVHIKKGNVGDAKKALDALKATGADEFWMKLADFTLEDGKWTEKYNQVSKKK